MLRLEGKVAFITGGGGGIGRVKKKKTTKSEIV